MARRAADGEAGPSNGAFHFFFFLALLRTDALVLVRGDNFALYSKEILSDHLYCSESSTS
jgi:hypothetical protein